MRLQIRATAFPLALISLPLALGATTLYWGGGSSNIADGTALPTTGAALVGTWNTALENWSNDSQTTNYGVWADGSLAFLGRRLADGGTPADPDITLESSIASTGLMNNSLVNTTNNLLVDLTAASAVTINTGSSGTFTVRTAMANLSSGIRLQSNVTLIGSATLLKEANGELRLAGNNNAFTGKVLAVGGGINLASTSSITGVTDITLGGMRVSMTDWGRSGNSGWNSGSMTVSSANSASNNQLADNAVITLSRGAFDYRPGGSSSVETIGKIVLAPTGSILSSQGTAGGTLILSDPTQGIERAATGTMIVNTVSASNPALTTKVRVTAPGAIPTNTLLPWAPTNYGSYTYIDSADNNTLKAFTAVNSNTDLSVWDTTYTSADIVRVNSATTTNAIDANTNVRALTFSGEFNTAVTLTLNAGVTLNVAEGGIYSQGSGNVVRTITGGDLTTSASQFFISTGNSNTHSLAINSRLTGSYDLVKFGVVPMVIGGPDANIFLGDVHVMEGQLTLNKTAVGGVAPAAVNGNVYVATGAGLNLGSNGSLPSSSNLTLARDGLLNIAATVTYGGVLTSNGGQIGFPNTAPVFNNAGYGLVLNGGYWQHNSTSTGTLNLQTNVKYESTATSQMRFERYSTGAFNIELDGAERVFDIANSGTLAAGVPEMVIDAVIAAGSPAGGSLKKTGAGTLQLTGVNTYTGGTTVQEGTLQLATISAAALSGITSTGISSGNLSNILTFDQPIASQFAVGQTVTTNYLPASRIVTGVLNDFQIMVNGVTGLGTTTATGGTAGTNLITTSNTGNLKVGAVIQGPGIPDGTTVTGITPSTSFTISNNLISNASTANGAYFIVNSSSDLAATAVSRTGSLASPVTVKSGATFGGVGTAKGAVTVESGGFIAPGTSVGTLVADGVNEANPMITLQAGAKLAVELAGSTADRIDLHNYVVGDLVLNNNAVDLSLSGSPADGTYTVDLVRFYSDAGVTASASGIASGLTIGSVGAGITNPTLIYGLTAIQLQYTVGAGGPDPVVPVLTIAQSGANLVISCPSESGFNYQLQSSPDLGDPWGAVETKPGTGGTITFTVAAPASGNADFYRVVVPAP